jgi:hypothetical protein
MVAGASSAGAASSRRTIRYAARDDQTRRSHAGGPRGRGEGAQVTRRGHERQDLPDHLRDGGHPATRHTGAGGEDRQGEREGTGGGHHQARPRRAGLHPGLRGEQAGRERLAGDEGDHDHEQRGLGQGTAAQQEQHGADQPAGERGPVRPVGQRPDLAHDPQGQERLPQEQDRRQIDHQHGRPARDLLPDREDEQHTHGREHRRDVTLQSVTAPQVTREHPREHDGEQRQHHQAHHVASGQS